MRELSLKATGETGVLARFLRKPSVMLNLVSTVAYQCLPFAVRPSTVKFSPVTYTIYLNNYCNYSCEFCFLTKRQAPHETLEFDDFRRIISHPFNGKAYRVTLGGGEPFLHPNLFDFARELKRQGKYVSVYTNGSLLEGAMEYLQHGDFDCINVSHYDGRFPGVIPFLREMGVRKGFPAVRLSKIIRRGDVGRMEEMIETALENRIPRLIFKNYQAQDLGEMDLVLKKRDAEVEGEIDRLRRKYRRAQLEITWPNLLDPDGPFDCRNTSLNIIYGPGGTIAPCCFIVPPSLAYGCLFSAADPWNGEAIRKVRRGEAAACTCCYFRHGLQNRLS